MREINRKLITIQQALKAPKSQFNEFGNFKYRNAEDILNAVKPLLAQEGLSLVLTDQMEYIGNRYYIKATAVLSDGEEEVTATAYAREDENRAGMSESQVTGCSSSYARKYALAGLFCLNDEKDSDAFDNGSNKGLKEQKGNPVPTQPLTAQNQPTEGQNLEILRSFCTEQKNSGANTDELKKFFDYFSKKMPGWRGVVKPDILWSRWNTKTVDVNQQYS
jgi:hypothetical protein